MDKVSKIYDSHSEADQADNEYYASLSPNKRVEILLELISNYASTYYDGFTERLQRVYKIIDRKEC